MSSVPRELRSELIYAAAAVNAWLRGMPVAKVALHYRYEPVTALHLIRRCCEQYGETNLAAWVPASVLRAAMIEDMAQVHMTEAEVTRDFAAVLEKLRQGAEVVVEQNHRPVAVIQRPRRSGRPIAECIASAKASGSRVTLDGGFAADVEEGIRNRQEPWTPPTWD